PEFYSLAFNNRFVILAYMHMVLLGLVSLFLIAWSAYENYLILHKKTTATGLIFLLCGIAITETIMVLTGTGFVISNFNLWLFIFSLLMTIGILLILAAQFTGKTEQSRDLSGIERSEKKALSLIKGN